MTEYHLQLLISLIEELRYKYPFPLTLQTEVQKDLGIWGDDSVDFLLEYSKRFSVDVSKFMMADYFHGEGYFLVGQPPVKSFTLAHLVEGMKLGRLDENVISLVKK